MTTTAEPLTILDPETVEELQPPCDIDHCGHAAEWIVKGHCDVCKTVHDLFCTAHKERIVSQGTKKSWLHTPCKGAIRLIGCEPL